MESQGNPRLAVRALFCAGASNTFVVIRTDLLANYSGNLLGKMARFIMSFANSSSSERPS
jgi:hypothetical protein